MFLCNLLIISHKDTKIFHSTTFSIVFLYRTHVLLICTVLIPFLTFWLLDAFFLHTERKYRKMYAWILQERKKGNNEYQYDLNPARFNEEIGCMAHSFFSKTLLLFYGIPTIVIVFLIIRLICQYIHSMT